MPPATDDTPPPAFGPGDQLRHDLRSPLTAIHARAQLLGRAIQRSPSLTVEEQTRMLESLAIIQEAVRTMVPVINTIGRDDADGSPDSAD